MKISELIASSAKIRSKNVSGHYSANYVFGHKQFGHVLSYNKTVLYKPSSSIVEIGMMITAVTEKGKTGHFCQIALRGVEMEAKSAEEVFAHIRNRGKGKMAQADDDELRDYIAAGNTVYNNKYVVQSRNNSNVYLVMNKNISPDTDCRVRCSCASFLFDVAWYNADHNCLIGSRPPADPRFQLGLKTETVRNIDKVPGLCKHLMLLVSMLLKDGFIQGGTDDITAYLEGGGTLPRSAGRISTSRANYMIEQTMKQHRAQVRMLNALNKGNLKPKQGMIRGTNVGKTLTGLGREIKKATNPTQKQTNVKNLGKRVMPKFSKKRKRK